MITFTVQTSHPEKEVHLKFSNGRLTSVVHNGHAYGIECVIPSEWRNLPRDYPLEQTLKEAISQRLVIYSDLEHQHRIMTIVFTEDIMLNASVIGSLERRNTRLFRILYKPHRRENHQG